jgi:hypothetical protein
VIKMAEYDKVIEELNKTRDSEYGYEAEAGKGKNFLDFIVEYIKASKESKKPKLESVT